MWGLVDWPHGAHVSFASHSWNAWSMKKKKNLVWLYTDVTCEWVSVWSLWRTCQVIPSPPEVGCSVSSHTPAEWPNALSPRESSPELLFQHRSRRNISLPVCVHTQKKHNNYFKNCILPLFIFSLILMTWRPFSHVTVQSFAPEPGKQR